MGKAQKIFSRQRGVAGMNTIDKIIRAIGALASILAAVFWLRSALLDVPDNIDTIVRELQRIGWWNSAAAWAAVVASLCAALIFLKQFPYKPFV
jgi:uncharacterized membrane protein YbhN (UPF0104 family)